jgi:hypothetical protein
MYILYKWINKHPQSSIVNTTKVSHKTVRKILNGIHQVIQEDLSMEDDLMIGKLYYFIYYYASS